MFKRVWLSIHSSVRSHPLHVYSAAGAVLLVCAALGAGSLILPNDKAGIAFVSGLYYPFILAIKGIEGLVLGTVTYYVFNFPQRIGVPIKLPNIIANVALAFVIGIAELNELIRNISAVKGSEVPAWRTHLHAAEAGPVVIWVFFLLVVSAMKCAISFRGKRT